MQFTISCEAFSRMAEIGRYNIGDIEDYFKSLYFERHNNTMFMVACNRAVVAIENLGVNVGPNEHCAVDVRNDYLIQQCDAATPFNGILEITCDDNLRWAFVKTNMGWSAPNCYVPLPKDNKLVAWRDLVPDELPKKTNGAMHWHAGLIHCLATASPSDRLSFPEFIDVEQPVLVKDAETSNWIGLFMPTLTNTDTTPATIPDWIKP